MKTKKFSTCLVALFVFSTAVLPLISEVALADTVVRPDANNSVFPFISDDRSLLNTGIDVQNWSNEKIDQLTDTLSELHPKFTKKYLRSLVISQLNDDGIPPLTQSDIVSSHLHGTLSYQGTWKGITVDQMAAVIDTIIGSIVGAGVGAIT